MLAVPHQRATPRPWSSVWSPTPRQYWRLTLTPERRAEFPWPGLLVAPTLVVVLTNPEQYVQRYSEPDKSHTGLGDSTEAWPVPYWWVDAGMAVQKPPHSRHHRQPRLLLLRHLRARVGGLVRSRHTGGPKSGGHRCVGLPIIRPPQPICFSPQALTGGDHLLRWPAMNMPDPVDRLAIEDTIVRYTIAIDEKDWDLLDTVFTPDAHLDYSSSAPGVDDANADYPTVKRWLQTALAIFPMTQHMVGKTYVRSWDGDTAQWHDAVPQSHGHPRWPTTARPSIPTAPSCSCSMWAAGITTPSVAPPTVFALSKRWRTSGYHDGGFPDGFGIPE